MARARSKHFDADHGSDVEAADVPTECRNNSMSFSRSRIGPDFSDASRTDRFPVLCSVRPRRLQSDEVTDEFFREQHLAMSDIEFNWDVAKR